MRTLKRLLPLISTALFCITAAALLTGCGQAGAVPADAPVSLPGLPDDGPYWTRSVSVDEPEIFLGSSTYSNSGAPGAAPHGSQPDWLTLDGDQASSGMAWALWQLPLSDTTVVDNIVVNLQQSGLNKYWLGYADYTAQQWQWHSGDEVSGTQTLSFEEGAAEAALHSPAHNAYIAVIVLPGSRINVAQLELTLSSGGGNGHVEFDEPIRDRLEDNDTLEISQSRALFLTEGEYHMSVHETFQEELAEVGEGTDDKDYFQVHLEAGETLTATVRHEVFDHFSGSMAATMDADLLFYNPAVVDELSGFLEQYSSFNIQYYPFEHISYTAGSAGDYQIGVLAAKDEPPFGIDDNVEYYLNLFISPSETTHQVSGYITQNGGEPDKQLVAFLEPGNFNAITRVDQQPHGYYLIEGVPEGTYTLKVHGNGGYPGQETYVWEETRQVIVSNNDLTSQNLDIGSDPT